MKSARRIYIRSNTFPRNMVPVWRARQHSPLREVKYQQWAYGGRAVLKGETKLLWKIAMRDDLLAHPF